MKPLSGLTRTGAILFTLVLASALTACGQKGPLYLPKPQPVATKPQPSQPQPNPATPEDGDTATPASK